MRLARFAVLVGALAAAPAHAATIYTSRAAFDAAVAGIPATAPGVVNFDAQTAGTAIPSGTGLGGIGFSYNIGGFQLAVLAAGSGGTSGLNTLGLKSGTGATARFAPGDSIDFTFAQPTRAFGFYVVVGSNAFDFFAADINLGFAGTTYTSPDSLTASTVGNASAVWVGIVDPAAAHSTATLRFGPPGASGGSLFELDDLSFATAIPEPASLALAAAGALMLSTRRRNA